MPRELRKRTERPNYAVLLRHEDEDEAGPSNSNHAQMLDDELDSGSDFAPEPHHENPEEDQEDQEDLLSEQPEEEDQLAEGISPPERIASTSRPSKAKKAVRKNVTLVPSVSVSRQPSTFPLPSIHHRHRAIPIHHRNGEVERLKHTPQLFKHCEVASTNSWSSNEVVGARVGKAWGHNVGTGPLWEIMEDRAWFKESAHNDDASEAARRPRVYESIGVPAEWKTLSPGDAASYLPSAMNSPDESAPHIKCSFGPFGSQQQLNIKMLDTLRMDKFFPESKSHVFNAGAPVWGLDWCPIHPDDRQALSFRQYLAVAPLPVQDYSLAIGVKKVRPVAACIQIWSLNPSVPPATNETEDRGVMRCDMILCIESGPAHELKWCPLPSNDTIQAREDRNSTPRKLGILAGTFEDGSLSIYAVPYPPDLMVGGDTSGPIYVKVAEPLLRVELENAACWSLDWANSEVLAVGCSNGSIAVYDISEALISKSTGSTQPVLPTHYFSAHQSAIRALSWIRAPTFSGDAEVTTDDPTVIVSGGYDGSLAVRDLREPTCNEIYRTRDIIYSICYSTYCGGPLSLDQSQVKVISLAPIMLNKGHTVMDPEGPVWSLGASDYHPQLAVGVTDGSCSTTNTLRSTRRGGAVPFLVHKIYQMDYSRKTGEYRMLENFLPKEIDRVAGARATKPPPKSSGAWPPEVAVQRVVWNNGNGLAHAPLLASATGNGLCRVDWLMGRWLKERIPYYGVEGIRNEVEADDEMEEDSD